MYRLPLLSNVIPSAPKPTSGLYVFIVAIRLRIFDQRLLDLDAFFVQLETEHAADQWLRAGDHDRVAGVHVAASRTMTALATTNPEQNTTALPGLPFFMGIRTTRDL